PALGVDVESVRAGLPTARGLAGVSTRLEENGHLFAFLEAVDLVLGNVGEEQIPALLHPDWPLGPVVSLAKLLDGRIARNEPVEPRVLPHYRAERGIACLRGGVLCQRCRSEEEPQDRCDCGRTQAPICSSHDVKPLTLGEEWNAPPARADGPRPCPESSPSTLSRQRARRCTRRQEMISSLGL